MSADGAQLGVTAGRALKTILGGEPSPRPDERMDAERFCQWIRSALNTLDCQTGEDGYSEACRILAKLLLTYSLEDRTALGRDCYRDLKAHFPDSAETIAGITGFMWGWSVNAAPRCSGMPPVPNPAVITIEIPEDK